MGGALCALSDVVVEPRLLGGACVVNAVGMSGDVPVDGVDPVGRDMPEWEREDAAVGSAVVLGGGAGDCGCRRGGCAAVQSGRRGKICPLPCAWGFACLVVVEWRHGRCV